MTLHAPAATLVRLMSESALLYSHRSFALSAIAAVGFDLDHTLALYDDPAVNELAASEARRLMVERLGYPGWLLEPDRPMEAPRAARTLAADLCRGAVVKLDADRRAVRARRAGRWLDTRELHALYPRPVGSGPGDVYAVHSPFELPVLWLLEELEARLPAEAGCADRCEDIRRMLDLAHTDGDLKPILRESLPRFVGGIDGVAAGLARWAAAGKRLFVVTNSEAGFAAAVLDFAVGPSWRRLFQVVVTRAQKPGFFRRDPRVEPSGPAPATGGAALLEGADALHVESLLGVRGDRVLFVGDNANTDIRAARSYGWRTAHVVPELALNGAGPDDWGAALSDAGRPTWLARLVRENADIVLDRVDRLLALDPHSALAPAARP